MKRTSKYVLCLVLSLVILFSMMTLPASASAAESPVTIDKQVINSDDVERTYDIRLTAAVNKNGISMTHVTITDKVTEGFDLVGALDLNNVRVNGSVPGADICSIGTVAKADGTTEITLTISSDYHVNTLELHYTIKAVGYYGSRFTDVDASIVYKVSDGESAYDPYTEYFSSPSVIIRPYALPDEYDFNFGETRTVPVGLGVLANDPGIMENRLELINPHEVAVIEPGYEDSVILNADGSFTYTAPDVGSTAVTQDFFYYTKQWIVGEEKSRTVYSSDPVKVTINLTEPEQVPSRPVSISVQINGEPSNDTVFHFIFTKRIASDRAGFSMPVDVTPGMPVIVDLPCGVYDVTTDNIPSGFTLSGIAPNPVLVSPYHMPLALCAEPGNYKKAAVLKDDIYSPAVPPIEVAVTYMHTPPAPPAPPAVQYSLQVAVEGDGTVLPGAGTYSRDSGTLQILSVTPGSGSVFVGWFGDNGSEVNAYGSNYGLMIGANKSIIARFAPAAEPTPAATSAPEPAPTPEPVEITPTPVPESSEVAILDTSVPIAGELVKTGGFPVELLFMAGGALAGSGLLMSRRRKQNKK